jgi:spermidine synthase
MKPDLKLAQASAPDNALLTLYQHDGDFSIRYNGRVLMHAKLNASEYLIGEIACQNLKKTKAPRILIGGLGLGYTLKAVLENTPDTAVIDIYELIPEVVEWNRTFMDELNGHLLKDPRVRIHVKDVCQALKQMEKGRYHALIMDIDNGPVAMVTTSNKEIYEEDGVSLMHNVLKKHGRAAIWSAQRHLQFERVFNRGGFSVERVSAKTYANARTNPYQIYIGDKR